MKRGAFMPLQQNRRYAFAEYRLDVTERLLSRNGERVPLSDRPFDVLCALLETSGSLVTKDRLIERVWGGAIVEENNLDKSISKLRHLLLEPKGSSKFIETVRGYDYRFVAEVKTEDRPTLRTASETTEARRTIAVLPFTNLSPDAESDYICDGLAEELLNTLSKARNLKVAARTSAFSFRHREVSTAEIGRALGVDTLLEGSVRQSGANVRIAIRMVNASDGYTFWSASFNRVIDDIFSLHDEVALAVFDALSVTLLGGERQAILKRHTDNAEAYLLYLKGQYYRWRTSPQDFANSLKYFEKSIAADQSFALGYFGISTFYGYWTAWGFLPIKPDLGWLRAEVAAERALKLDASLPELRISFAAFALVHHRKWDEAGKNISQIAASNPRFPEIHHLYSFYLLACGEFDQAIAEARAALELDPLSVVFSRFVAVCLYYARRLNEAIGQLNDTLELDPNNPETHEMSAEIYSHMDMSAEAINSLQNAARLAGDDEKLAVLASCVDKDLRDVMRKLAKIRLSELKSRADNVDYLPSIFFCREYLSMGDTDNALEWLARACTERNVFPLLINSDPFYDGIRDDPQFREMVREVGIPTARG